MGLTKWQLAAREHRVGASEVPALLGLSPYAGPADVWDRLMGVEVAKDPSINMRVGSYLEPHVLKMARWLGLKAYRCNRAYVHDTLPLSASPDAYTEPHRGYPKGLAEVKVTGAWTPGVDRAPEYVRAQVQTQLLLTGRPVAWIVALQGSALNLYVEEPDPEYMDRIEAVVAAFQRDHLITGVRPDPITEPFKGFTRKET